MRFVESQQDLAQERHVLVMGLIGHARTAVTAAMLSVFLNMALFFWAL